MGKLNPHNNKNKYCKNPSAKRIQKGIFKEKNYLKYRYRFEKYFNF